MAKIIAFIDASVYATSVCDHAAWVATRMSASVEVFHVLGRRDMSGDGGDLTGALDVNARDSLLAELSALDEQKAKLAQKRGRLILERASQRLRDQGVMDVSPKLRIADLVETVQEFEPSADLVVVGKRGEAADFAKLHLGSNLERIVRSSHKPVLVASRAFKPIDRVMIAHDGGDSVNRAVNYLCASHDLFRGLDMHVLHVGDPTGDAYRRGEDAVARLRMAGYQARLSAVPGQPDVVVAGKVASERIDLLVMGAYGHSRIRTLIIGSTTTEMIRSCLIPVVLFR